MCYTKFLALVLASMALVPVASAQNSSVSETAAVAEKEPYVKQMSEIMARWNNKEIAFRKEEFNADFASAIDRRIDKPVHDFESKPEYREIMLARWEELPDEVLPTLPLSTGAQLLLAGIIADRGENIQAEFGQGADLLGKFGMSFYTTFGASQVEAQNGGTADIDSLAVVSGLSKFWSVPYPFCCWRVWR